MTEEVRKLKVSWQWSCSLHVLSITACEHLQPLEDHHCKHLTLLVYGKPHVKTKESTDYLMLILSSVHLKQTASIQQAGDW